MPKFRLFPLFVFLCALMLFSGASYAQNLQLLKQSLDSYIETKKLEAQENGLTLITEGQTTVEEAGAYYAITLPNIKIKDSAENITKIGLIAMNASPLKNEDDENVAGQYKISIALPTPIIVENKQGQKLYALNINSQKMGAIWNQNNQKFTQISGAYGGITLQDFATNYTHKIGALGLKTNIKPLQDKNWSGMMGVSLEKVQSKYFSLASLKLSASISDFLSMTAKNDLNFTYNGFKSYEADLAPEAGSGTLNIKNFSMDKLYEILKSFYATRNNPSARQVLMLQNMLVLPQIMAEAGSIINIKNLILNSDKYKTETNGVVKGSASAALGLIGKITVTYQELEKMIAYLEGNAGNAAIVKKLKAVQEICKGSCVIELNNEGRFLVNNQDMLPLLQ